MNVTEYIERVLPGMEGWCTKEKAAKLAEIVTSDRPSIIVEIGVFAGRSLFVMAMAQKEIGYGSRITIGIDPWKSSASTEGLKDENAEWWGKLDHDDIYRQCRTSLAVLNLKSECHILRSTSADALSFIQRLPAIDMAHIDGNHSAEIALFDVENYVPLVNPGGVIAFDDISWSTTKPAQSRLLELADPIEQVGDCGFFRRKSHPLEAQSIKVAHDPYPLRFNSKTPGQAC